MSFDAGPSVVSFWHRIIELAATVGREPCLTVHPNDFEGFSTKFMYRPSQEPSLNAAHDPTKASRFAVGNYAATVNGRAAKVSRSPSGLVAVRLESGANDVVLRYPGPWPLRAAYWTALFTWVAVVVLLVRHAVRRWPTAASA